MRVVLLSLVLASSPVTVLAQDAPPEFSGAERTPESANSGGSVAPEFSRAKLAPESADSGGFMALEFSGARSTPEGAVRILLGSGSIANRTHARYLAPEDLLPRPSVSIGAQPLPSTPIAPSYRGPFVHVADVPSVRIVR